MKATRTKPMLKLLLLLTMLIWIMVLCCCSIGTVKSNPAKQQRSTTSPQPIPVNQVDLNQDGVIDTSEQQQFTEDTPGVLGTFMCIGGATILICLGSAWICTRSTRPKSEVSEPDISDTSEQLIQEQDFDGTQHQPAEHTDQGDWLDSGQHFEHGGKHR